MEHRDHVRLLQPGTPARGGVWADFGSGRGAFTLALAELIGPGGQIHSIDKSRRALQQQENQMRKYFPQVSTTYHAADFTHSLKLPRLDGIVMANALHFIRYGRAQELVLKQIWTCLRPGGRLILGEYGTDRGNHWVPYPLSFNSWADLAVRCGFENPAFLADYPSRFLGQIYPSSALRPVEPTI